VNKPPPPAPRKPGARPAPPGALPKPPRPPPPAKPGKGASAAAAAARYAAAEEPEGPEEGTIVAGKYELERLIARGGMGAVWEGRDMELERPVAVKFMASAIASSKSLRARFLREAQAAAQLRTSHVVQIYEHGLHEKTPFIVMELLEGEELHQRLKRERRIPLVTAARIVTQTAKALRRAHAKGIIHRDLKPANIFLATDDDEEIVKILDFGIAKNIKRDSDGDTTRTGQVLGSPNYMSPEQARGFKEIDHRTDLWSLGVIIYRMVTGKPAFKGEAAGDVIVKICTDPLPVASQVATDLPVAIDQFLHKALARDPDARFQSATELAEAFVETVRACGSVAWANASGRDADSLSQPGDWTPVSGVGTDPGSFDSLASMPGAASISGPGGLPTPTSSQPGISSEPGPSSPGLDLAGEGGTPAELTPAPMGSSPDSLSQAAMLAMTDPPAGGRSKRWLGLGAGAAALILVVAGAWALSSSETTPAAPADTSANDAPPTAAASHEEPTPPAAVTTDPTGAGGATASSEPVGGGPPEALPTSSASSPPSAPPVAAKPPPKPPRPPKPPPKPTATKTKRNWGY